MPEQSLLDARLAEIDRRLRAIQAGLRPAEEGLVEPDRVEPETVEPRTVEPRTVEREPPAVEAPAAELTPADLVGELRALADAHERLLELHRELLSEYASLLQRRVAEQSPPAAAP